MCGIVAVIRRPSKRHAPAPDELLATLREAATTLVQARSAPSGLLEELGSAHAQLAALDEALRGMPGLQCLLADPALLVALERETERLGQLIGEIEQEIDTGVLAHVPEDVEQLNAAFVALKDVLWTIRADRVGHARAVARHVGGNASPTEIEAFSSIELALSALERLEVRGRDSAGIHLLLSAGELDLGGDTGVAEQLAVRRDPLFRNGSARAGEGSLGLVYKVAKEVGELGENTRHLRAAIAADPLLRRALEHTSVRVSVLGHTRWASVGMINEANAHPVNEEEDEVAPLPHVVAALNGDVDNHRRLAVENELRIPVGITTDARIIPTLTARAIASGSSPAEAFRTTMNALQGSVAVAAVSARDPSKLMLGLRGSGQSLCIGVADDLYMVASEPYGIVEATSHFVRMDGEVINADGSRGQIVALDMDAAGDVERIDRLTYGGERLAVDAGDLIESEITTRDIHRGESPHFLLKEIRESPDTMRKTLRGRIVEVDGRRRVRLGAQAIPAALEQRVRAGGVRRIIVIGQGTAAVASAGIATALESALRRATIAVSSEPASELSAYGLVEDMGDVLIVAVSQSGTTTDTNRTIDLARARGAAVIAIVNRRNSDLAHKADGVIYTSDGRDVEMSVASTKAFYSQIVAGFLLGFALARATGSIDLDHESALLDGLVSLPAAMEAVLAQRAHIRELACALAPQRRHWAIVGSGRNLVAAHEIRIKMAELCYKSIALDVTEDKKHIDLSSEPLTLVCATGVAGAAAVDVAKEVAIFRAHNGTPVLIATDGVEEFAGIEPMVTVPPVHGELAYVLSTVVGHLFGYEAALAIDAQANPLREARMVVDELAQRAVDADSILRQLPARLEAQIGDFRRRLAGGGYDAALAPSTAGRLTSLLSYVEGDRRFDLYDREFGRPGTPTNLIEDLTATLTLAIDDLTRPIDTIRHQAKTVTVGISRSEEELFDVPLVQAVLAAGVERGRLTYLNLRALVALSPAVEAVSGYSRYQIVGAPGDDAATIALIDQGGAARAAKSRTAVDPTLRGTKKIVAAERQVLIARGRSDGRLVIFVPEVAAGVTTGMSLLHVSLHPSLAPSQLRLVMHGYRERLAALADAVIESEGSFDERELQASDLEELLTAPIDVLADRWRGSRAASTFDVAEEPTAAAVPTKRT